ncbi:energy transducer TonB [uncultured Spirosoma sp.]|uniref:energy transducer TonB n=1 Tax=uncultured Spirosoma sp. TaxID=278208 RepID=UPI002582CBD8|nr:energy transducer TonB [uncultured Spirosoma sp.]
MKQILTGLLSLVMTCHALGQDVSTSIAGNPGLTTYLLKNIRFPTAAQRRKSEGRLYLYLDVDRQGNIANADVKNPNGIDTLFVNEVVKVSRTIPKQDARYEGHYVLPVVFAHVERGQEYVAKALTRQETRLVKRSRKRTLLSEIVVESYGIIWKKMSVFRRPLQRLRSAVAAGGV